MSSAAVWLPQDASIFCPRQWRVFAMSRSVLNRAWPLLFWASYLRVSCQLAQHDLMISLRSKGVGEPVVIVTSLPLDCCSTFSHYGRMMRHNYEMLIDWISVHRGGIRLDGPSSTPRPFEIKMYNDYSDPGEVRRIYNMLLHTLGHRLLLATYSSGLGEVAASLVNDTDAVLLAPCSASPSVFRDRPNVFSTLTPSTQYLIGPSEVPATKANSISYVYESAAFSKSMCNSVPRIAGTNDLFIRTAQEIEENPSRETIRSTLTNLMEDPGGPPDLFVACVYRNACMMFLEEMERIQFYAKAVIMSSCTTEEFNQLKQSSQYVMGMTSWLPSFPLTCEITNRSNLEFTQEYRSKFNEEPTYQGMSAQTSLLALFDAIERTRSTEPALVSTQIRITSARTLFGQISFDENGQSQMPFKGTQVVRYDAAVDAMAMHIASPADSAETSLIYPMPTWIERECLQVERSTVYGMNVNNTCVECSAGHVSEWSNLTSTRHCVPCTAGNAPSFGFSEDGLQVVCQVCPKGRAGPRDGMAECEFCATGRFADMVGRTACSACPPGKAGDAQGIFACHDCGVGTFAAGNESISCTRCPIGRYTSGRGATACTACPQGMTTSGSGGTSEADCVCPRDHVLTMRSHAGLEGLNPANFSEVTCTSCSVGLECDVGTFDPRLDGVFVGKGNSHPILLPGFWSDHSRPLDIFRCADSVACPGGIAGTCGHHRVNIACGACDEDYYQSGGSCTKCSGLEASGVLYGVVAFAPFAILLKYRFSRDTIDKWGRFNHKLTSMVPILLRNYQTIALTRKAAIEFPESTSKSWSAFEYLLDVWQLIRVDCAGFHSFGSMVILKTVLPLLILSTFCLTYLGSSGASRALDLEHLDHNVLCSIFITVMVSFYLSIVSLSMSMFMCYPHPEPNQELSLIAAPHIMCGGNEWREFVVYAVLSILVYIVAWLAFIIYICAVAPNQFQYPWFKRRYKCLFLMYAPHAWWWSLVIMLMGTMLSVAQSVFTTPAFKVMGCLVTLIIYAGLTAAIRPWRHSTSYIMDVFATGAIIFVVSNSLWYAGLGGERQAALDSVVVLVSFLPLVISSVLAAFILSTRNKHENLVQTAGSIQDAFQSVAQLSSASAQTFVDNLATSDRRILKEASNVILAELQGKQPIRLLDARLVTYQGGVRATFFDSIGARPAPTTMEPTSPKKIRPSPTMESMFGSAR